MSLSNEKYLKPVVACIASIIFLTVSIIVAYNARYYQVSHQPMPNGKRGFMSPSDGYQIAVVFLLMAIASFIVAYKAWKGLDTRR